MIIILEVIVYIVVVFDVDFFVPDTAAVKFLADVQIFLRQVLVLGDVDAEMVDEEILLQLQNLRDVLKYAVIVVSTAPLMCAYPFVQKYFVKGVMIGSLKG